jgi:hypothetical protein
MNKMEQKIHDINIVKHNPNIDNPKYCALLRNEECLGAKDYHQFLSHCSKSPDAHAKCNYDPSPIFFGGDK